MTEVGGRRWSGRRGAGAAWAALVSAALVALGLSGAVHADDPRVGLQRQTAALAAAAARESERARLARLQWASERRGSASHARMPDTMYASTPSAVAVDLSCPVATEDEVHRVLRGGPARDDAGRRQSTDWSRPLASPVDRPAPDGAAWLSRAGGGGRAVTAPLHGSSSAAILGGGAARGYFVPLFPSASRAALRGVVRVVNHSAASGEVRVEAVDDAGRRHGALVLWIDAGGTASFDSADLEYGNAAQGLGWGTGTGEGDWHLWLASALDVEVLSYVRSGDGYLAPMHDVAPLADGARRIAFFHPAGGDGPTGLLRLVNAGGAEARVAIRGVDDLGASPGGPVTLTLAAGGARTLTAAELESGGPGLSGTLGDGAGRWRLRVTADQPVHAMSLMSSPAGRLSNLSTAPSSLVDGAHRVALFPSASDPALRGLVRVVNRSGSVAEVRIVARDDTDWAYEPLRLTVAAGAAAHFDSDDLERGNAAGSLVGGTGPGQGHWRLALTSDADIEVLSYARAADGLLAPMHDAVPVIGGRHRLALPSRADDDRRVGLLRVVNAGPEPVAVTIRGVDDLGLSPGGEVRLSVPAGGVRMLSARALESGGDGFAGALGDGAGGWRLSVSSDRPVRVQGLLSSPTGHLANVSTTTKASDASGGDDTAADLFAKSISGIVQSKCVNCHVAGGASGNTRLVFVRDTDADHLSKNLATFETFLADVEDGAKLILNKVQGVEHGGGVQLSAGTDDFANLEGFLTSLGEDVVPVTITPATLFDGVKMMSRRSTLRRAAIVFAGRVPTEAEYASVEKGGLGRLRKAIRALMTGPGFHEFLIRASNDRLLTDRDDMPIDPIFGYFVDFNNSNYSKSVAALTQFSNAWDDPTYVRWRREVGYGIGRAPLELIAHVAENDLPYTDMLTADYIMANPVAVEAYGASPEFDDQQYLHDFRPSKIVSYYRKCDGHEMEYHLSTGAKVTNSGPCATDYPHAGILNTTVFLLRYPTTATNRNRARSRWTYYHFLGVDIEKSASRTTDPIALADTNNPTMHNAACTVCHGVLDPVAGAFQNYDDVGYYRSGWGGMDSLDYHYKDGFAAARAMLEVVAPREDPHVLTVGAYLTGGSQGKERVRLHPRFDPPRPDGSEIWWHMGIDHVKLRDARGRLVQHVELQDVVEEMDLCGPTDQPNDHYLPWFCDQNVTLDVPASGDYEVELALWFDRENREGDAVDRRRLLDVSVGGHVEGDAWYRDMREPGFGGKPAPRADNSLQWLAKRIVADPRFAEATVKFWWPALMGAEVAEPPAQGDADFDGRLLASNAQVAEVARLGRGFRRGFYGGNAYNLKDLLAEMALSKWFRAEALSGNDPVRAVALNNAGATRLLTPEELSRKTVALTGFDWGRGGKKNWYNPGDPVNWTDPEWQYGLLYGGIDSDGITERAREFTSIMAGVAQRHAGAMSCPVVMKDFYFVSDDDRMLFGGIDQTVSPTSEINATFDIEATAPEAETLTLRGKLSAGTKTVRLEYVNDYCCEGGDRNVRLDRLDLRTVSGRLVSTRELEELDRVGEYCEPDGDSFWLAVNCSLDAPVEVPSDGDYVVEIVAWGEQAGAELPQLVVDVESDTVVAVVENVVRQKLVELYDKLLGVELDAKSSDVQAAFDLFVDVWNRGRNSNRGDFQDTRCDWYQDAHYFDGIADHLWRTELDEWGNEKGWDWDAANEFIWEDTRMPDPHHVARTWVVVLAYLMTDPRYLHL